PLIMQRQPHQTQNGVVDPVSVNLHAASLSQIIAATAAQSGRLQINGERHYLWRAVDHEGEVLESFVTKTRDKKATLKFLKKSMKRYGRPHIFVTDKLRSYSAASKEVGAADRQATGRWLNNRAENSHLPFRRRERAMQRFRRMRSLQMFAAVHASVVNHFSQERHLYSRQNFKLNRAAALAEWRGLGAS
ncbi:IS6 family transposase, partial [Albidovulum salinarum]|uniref:IS6 family transposase n=1 Tax=Albidovulum salinarum TaxID=2984153 RepID=UPI003988DE4C